MDRNYLDNNNGFNSYTYNNSLNNSNLNESVMSARRGINDYTNNRADQINNLFFNKNNLSSVNNNNFNQNMNNIVKSTLKSRGVIFTQDDERQNPHNQNIPVSSYRNNDNNNYEVTERKKMLLNNIQQQISLTKNSKLLELEKKKLEEDKYVKDMQQFYPFGR
jgi:hypothetical protein